MTDGRYAEAARAVEGVEARIVERDFLPGIATELGRLADAPVAFESDHVTVARHADCSRRESSSSRSRPCR